MAARQLCLSLGFVVFATFQAHAESSSVVIPPADGSVDAPLDVLHNKKFEQDDRIIDTEMKANSGSLSRYSLKANLGYSGPGIDSLNDPNRPNPDHKARPNRTSLSGGVSARYRVSSDAAWNAGTAMHWYSPYQAVTGQPVKREANDNKDFTVQDPMVSYDRTYLLAGIQSYSSVKVSATTETYYVNNGQFSELSFSQGGKYNIGSSRFILGGSVGADWFLFNRPFRKGDNKVSNYYLSAIPSLEYKITSTFNFKTSLAYAWANSRSRGNWVDWDQQAINQWVGFGWGITRDVYVNPYASFYTVHPAIASTSFNISTIFSVF